MKMTLKTDRTGTDQHRALRTLRDRLPRLLAALELVPDFDVRSWANVLDTKLLVRLDPSFPLVVAIAGGGSTGKSTLFNSLVDQDVALAGADAGMTRRALIATNPQLLTNERFVAELFHPFGAIPEPIGDRQELLEPGPPKIVAAESLPENLVLIDTPDFDTGDTEGYTNRHLAKPILEACDVLIYLFTGATYNNRDAGRFIREIASEIGQRDAVLVYRIGDAIQDDQATAHCLVVARKLYDSEPDEHILGFYRCPESNDVARQEEWMEFRPLEEGPSLLALLGELDPHDVRRKQTEAALHDVLDKAVHASEHARWSLDALTIYRDTLRIEQGHCVTQALTKLPVRKVMERIAEIWSETSPLPVRVLRGAGRLLGMPTKFVFHDVPKWVLEVFGGNDAIAAEGDPLEKQLADVEEAASRLHRTLLLDEISTVTTKSDPDGCSLLQRIDTVRRAARLDDVTSPRYESGDRGKYHVYAKAHPTTGQGRDRLKQSEWVSTLERVCDAARGILKMPIDQDLEEELRRVVLDFRAKMTLRKKLREIFFAALHGVPVLMAATYVVISGAPVGGGGIYAKVSGMFGLHDLWAFLALPAHTGLNEADRKQLETLLAPAMSSWVSSRATT